MKLPSKELLSEVLGLKINLVEIDEARNKVFYYCNQFGKITGEISTFELAHKCKEWAKLKHFIDIDSHPGCARWGAKAVSHNGKPSVFYEQVFIGRTEPEAIFKACEYIMEQTKCGS